MYKHSHINHHQVRPISSFAGNAADVSEILISGAGATIGPILLFPLNARLFLILNVLNQIWSIYLHNNKVHRCPSWINDPLGHNIHHYYGQHNYNYGLYTEFWDRILGTYKETVDVAPKLNTKKKY